MGQKKMSKWTFSPEELDDRFEEASRLGEEALLREPRARRVYYDGHDRRLAFEMVDGTLIAIPIGHIQGLSTATASDLNRLQLTEHGDTIQFDRLDLDIGVAGLISGVFGS